jgi:bifunctional DNA-binding transcriptional regulator/antitoxin component of YhaV-PrlF toxin-antitoxin module
MISTIQINKRGSLTLPKRLRKTLGLENGGVVIAEPLDQGILLKPAVAFPIELYSDSRIAEFDKADAELDRYLSAKKAK